MEKFGEWMLVMVTALWLYCQLQHLDMTAVVDFMFVYFPATQTVHIQYQPQFPLPKPINSCHPLCLRKWHLLVILRLVLETWCPHHWFSFFSHGTLAPFWNPGGWLAFRYTPRIHLSPHLSCLIHVILCLDHCSLLAHLFCSCTSIVHSRIARFFSHMWPIMPFFCPLAPLLSYQSTVSTPGSSWPQNHPDDLASGCLADLGSSLFCHLCFSRTGSRLQEHATHASRLEPHYPLPTVTLPHLVPYQLKYHLLGELPGHCQSNITSNTIFLTLPWFIYVFYLLSFPLSLGYGFHEGRNFFFLILYTALSPEAWDFMGFQKNIIWYAGHITIFFLTIILVH